MIEAPPIDWISVFSNFTWIVGCSVILAFWGIVDFHAHVEKKTRREIMQRFGIKKAFKMGVILIVVGVLLTWIL